MADWTARRKQLWGMTDGSPLPLNATRKESEAGLSAKENKLIDEIADRIYARGRKISGGFSDLDADRDGKVSVQDIMAGLTKWGMVFAERSIFEALCGKYAPSGVFDFGAFVHMMNKDTPTGVDHSVADKQPSAAATPATPPAPATPKRAPVPFATVEAEEPAPAEPASPAPAKHADLSAIRRLFDSDEEELSVMALAEGLSLLKVELSSLQKRKMGHELDTDPRRKFTYTGFREFLGAVGVEALPAAGTPASPKKGSIKVTPLPLRQAPFAEMDRVAGAVGLPAATRPTDKQRLDQAVARLAEARGQSVELLAADLAKSWDRSHKGWMSYADFKRGVTDVLQLDLSEAALDRLVRRLDTAADGRLSAEMLAAFLTAGDTVDDARSVLSSARSVRSARSDLSRSVSRPSTSNPITGEGMAAPSAATGKRMAPRMHSASNPVTGP